MIPGIIAQRRGGEFVPPGSSSSESPGGDPDFASVISLLHLDGTNASTTITDQISGKTWTASGSAALSTTDPKFGTACLLVPGSSGKILSNTDAADAFGTSDFTVEFWIRPTAWAASVVHIIYDTRTSGTEVRPTLYCLGPALRYFVNGVDRITGGDVSTGAYSHIAICRASGDTRLFINGVQSGSTYADSNNYVNDRTAWSGPPYATDNPINGRIDEARITKGVARYTANFTPPSEAFPDS